MAEAFAQGSEEIALRELEKYISRVQEGPQSMLMQLYIFSEFIGELGRLSRANGIVFVLLNRTGEGIPAFIRLKDSCAGFIAAPNSIMTGVIDD
mgnify:CR=1 FL=1